MNLNRNYFSSSDDDDVVLRRPYKRIRLMSDSDISNSGDVISFHRLQIGSGSETETAVDTDTATLTAEEGDNYHYNMSEEDFDPDWHIPLPIENNIIFSDLSGVNTDETDIFACREPHDFFFLFVTDELFEIIANQTNIYASQMII